MSLAAPAAFVALIDGSLQSLSQMDAARGDWEAAAQHCRAALATNADFLQARNLCAAVLRRAGKAAEAAELVAGSRQLDPLDWWSAHLAACGGIGGSSGDSGGEDGHAEGGAGAGAGSASKGLGCDTQTALDVALDFADAGGCCSGRHAAVHAVRCPAEPMRRAPARGDQCRLGRGLGCALPPHALPGFCCLPPHTLPAWLPLSAPTHIACPTSTVCLHTHLAHALASIFCPHRNAQDCTEKRSTC